MMKSVRGPERAYAIVLWVLSVIFAGFIVGFGNLVIGDLPQVEQQVVEQPGPDPAQVRIKAQLNRVASELARIDDRRTIAQLQLDQARKAS
ncbi:MAG TPA: zinc ribbon domain-containing protein, partial [Novosphingobium sp.]